jgi:hypothetical protein
MAARFAWVLNLDADLELGAGAGYQPTSAVKNAMRAHVASLAASLLAPGDVLVDVEAAGETARGFTGRAFCPTPRALAALVRAGADPEPHPTVEVLRRVNSRAFASSLGATLPGAAFVTELDAARAHLAKAPPVGSRWRVKHAFGMAGRNQRVFAPGAVDGSELAFVRTGLVRGGVQLEPDVAIDEEYAMHGMIAGDGAFRLGALVRQRCDGRGAWLSSEPLLARATLGDMLDRIEDEARRVATALHGAGYFGPFGVDAYSYRDGSGQRLLQPRSEINARYSMGFAVGFDNFIQGETNQT